MIILRQPNAVGSHVAEVVGTGRRILPAEWTPFAKAFRLNDEIINDRDLFISGFALDCGIYRSKFNEHAVLYVRFGDMRFDVDVCVAATQFDKTGIPQALPAPKPLTFADSFSFKVNVNLASEEAIERSRVFVFGIQKRLM